MQERTLEQRIIDFFDYQCHYQHITFERLAEHPEESIYLGGKLQGIETIISDMENEFADILEGHKNEYMEV